MPDQHKQYWLLEADALLFVHWQKKVDPKKKANKNIFLITIISLKVPW